MTEQTEIRHVIDGQDAAEVKALWIANHKVNDAVASALTPMEMRPNEVRDAVQALSQAERAEADRAVSEAIETSPDLMATIMLTVFHSEVDEARRLAGDEVDAEHGS